MVREIFDIIVRPLSYDSPKIPVDVRKNNLHRKLNLNKFIAVLFQYINAKLLLTLSVNLTV